MPKMVEYLKADKGTDEETKAKGELQGALKQFDEALTKKVTSSLPWAARTASADMHRVNSALCKSSRSSLRGIRQQRT